MGLLQLQRAIYGLIFSRTLRKDFFLGGTLLEKSWELTPAEIEALRQGGLGPF